MRIVPDVNCAGCGSRSPISSEVHRVGRATDPAVSAVSTIAMGVRRPRCGGRTPPAMQSSTRPPTRRLRHAGDPTAAAKTVSAWGPAPTMTRPRGPREHDSSERHPGPAGRPHRPLQTGRLRELTWRAESILADLAAIRDHLTAAEESASGSATYRRKASVTFLRIWKSPHAKPTPTPTLARSSQPLPTGRRPLTTVGIRMKLRTSEKVAPRTVLVSSRIQIETFRYPLTKLAATTPWSSALERPVSATPLVHRSNGPRCSSRA